MNLEPGLPQYHQQQQRQQQQLPSQDDRRVTHRQTATERLHAQAQAYHSAPMWQQQQQQQTLDSDQRPAPQSAFNSELLSQDLEQVMSPIFVDQTKQKPRVFHPFSAAAAQFRFLPVLCQAYPVLVASL
jgi:type II secretory pathway component HofQ